MTNFQNNQWLEKAQKASLERGHSLVMEESEFLKGNSRITITSSKCETKSSDKLLRSYLQLTSEAAGCNACANKKYGARFLFTQKTLTKIQDTKKKY